MFHSIQGWFQREVPSDPDRVVEVHVEDYVLRTPLARHEGLVLYGTPHDTGRELEIVMQLDLQHSYSKAFSLYRTSDEKAGWDLFDQYQAKLPLLVQCVPEIGISKFVLQNVLQLIREKPTWTIAHIAAHFGYITCLKNDVVQSEVNKTCPITHMTPLHVAVKSQQVGSVAALADLGVCVDQTDLLNGETVFHYAATTTKDIIQVLAHMPSAAAVLNLPNWKGCTPFHLACMADKADCVMEFLKAGVDVNLPCNPSPSMSAADSPSRCMKDVLNTYSSRFCNMDIKYGGTPLHWAKTPELTEALIEHGCNVNARNFQCDSALHIMVKRNRLSCAVVLLSHGAQCDMQNDKGDTPLHCAVRGCDLSLVHALITFGADLDLLNNIGESIRHVAAAAEKKGGSCEEILYALHVVGAQRCSVQMVGCNEGCSTHGQFNGIAPAKCAFSKRNETVLEDLLQQHRTSQNSFSTNGSLRVLSLDGGGIRGMVLIQMLDELERALGRPPLECFDFVAGTSTGGILAMVLASGKSMSECRRLYFRLKDKVFVGNRPYDADLLETFLKDELGESTTMGDIPRPKLMITATRGDRKPADLHLFRNYESPLEILGHTERDALTGETLPNPREQLIWQACRATGAAPTYFRAHGPFIDGGLISNNPTLDALTEIHQRNQALELVGRGDEVEFVRVLVSMGTGRPPVLLVNTIDVFRPDTLWGACRMALGVTNLGQLLIDQATQTDGRVTARCLAMCGMLGIPYFRLNPQMSEGIALDETNTKILVRVLWETTAYMRSITEDLQDLGKLLLLPST